jgi:hypothetical protein
MAIRVVTSIAAAVVLAVGTFVELRYRRRKPASPEDDIWEPDVQDNIQPIEAGDEDDVADIIRRARPALERAGELDNPSIPPEARRP